MKFVINDRGVLMRAPEGTFGALYCPNFAMGDRRRIRAVAQEISC